MPDVQDVNDPTVDGSATPAGTPPVVEPSGGGGGEPKGPGAPKTFDEAYVQTLRGEAASYRKRAKDAEASLDGVRNEYDGWKSPDDHTAALKDLQDQNAELSRELVATRKGIPSELAGKISGTTREEMEADADLLSKFMQTASGEAFRKGMGSGIGWSGSDVGAFTGGPFEIANRMVPRK